MVQPRGKLSKRSKIHSGNLFSMRIDSSRTGVGVLLKGKILLDGGCIVFGRVVNEWNG